MPLRSVLLLLAGPLLAADPSKVLFIGNSYTGANTLPTVYAEIVKSVGKAVPTVKSSTPAGRTLQQQLASQGSTDLIDEGGWDAVVLQGHSQEAALSENDEERRKIFLGAAHELCLRIRQSSPTAKVVLYQTWARHGDLWKNEKTRGPALLLGKDPLEMQTRIDRWYDAVAKAEGCEVAPVGNAWRLNYATSPAVRLHAPDNSHPNFAGTYLAALVIFGRIHAVPAPSPSWKGAEKMEISSDAAKRLQAHAASVLAR